MDYNNNGPEWRREDPMQTGNQSPYPQPSPYPPGNSQVVLREVRQQKENGMSVAALVLGIVTLIFFWVPIISLITGIVGVVMAIIGLVKEDHKAMPIIGMILSLIGLALSSLMILGYIVEYLTYMY